MDEDSDSDGMCSDIRLLRRSLGLSASAKKRPVESMDRAVESPVRRTQSPVRQRQILERTVESPVRPTQILERSAESPVLATQILKRTVESPIRPTHIPEQPQPHNPSQPKPPTTQPVTPGEIAALLSPPKRTKRPRIPSTHTSSTSPGTHTGRSSLTPQRTASSRMASLWASLDASPLPTRRTPLRSPQVVAQAAGPLGSVEDALVTPADLDQAARKLGASRALTQQRQLEDLRRRLLQFAQPLGEPHTAVEATLLCQFHTMGHGHVSLAQRGVGWRGAMLGALGGDAETQTAQGLQMAELVFPWQRVTAARRKHVDGQELLLMTVDEDLGLGFVCAQPAAAIDALAARMLELQSAARAQLADSRKAAGDREAAALARRLLALATDMQADEVERLATPQFLDDARPLVLRLAAQLAELARQDSTETLPGTCTLCYAAPEAHALDPCGHRLCAACLARLQTPGHPLLCPWDRTPATGHTPA